MQNRKKKVLAKLGLVCRQMEGLMAGQNVTVSGISLPQDADPSETKLEKLQRFKTLLNETLAELNRGDPRTCMHCGGAIRPLALDEMPWAWSCSGCAGKK